MNTTVFGKLTHAHFVYSTIHFNMLIKRKTVLNSYKSASRRIDTLSEVVVAGWGDGGGEANSAKVFPGVNYFPFSVDPFSEGLACGKTNKLQKLVSLTLGAKFQMIFVVCFSFLTNYRLKRSLYVKSKD